MRKMLTNKVAREMCKFRAEMMKKEKEEIYNSHAEIFFYENVYEYLTSDYVRYDDEEIKLCLKVDYFLDSLYNFYIDSFIPGVQNFDDICELVADFIEVLEEQYESSIEEN